MRVKFKGIFKGGTSLFILVMLWSASSYGMIVNITTKDEAGVSQPAKDHNNGNLGAGSKIEFFSIVDGPPPNGVINTNDIDRPDVNGNIINDAVISLTHPETGADLSANLVFGADGNIDFLAAMPDFAVGTLVYVRIWEGVPGSGDGACYMDIPYTVANEPVKTIRVGSKKVDRKNSPPPVPSINPDTLSEKLARQALPSENYDLQLDYDIDRTADDPANTSIFLDRYEVRVRRSDDGADWEAWPENTNGINFFTHSGLITRVGVPSEGLTPVNAYYERGKCYDFQVRSVNHLGPSNWSNPLPDAKKYQSLGEGAGVAAGVQEITLQFKKPADKPGLNFISLPFKDNYAYTDAGQPLNNADDGTNKIASAYDLIRIINNAAGEHVVATFGRWNSDNQSDAGILIPLVGDPPIPDETHPDNAAVANALKGEILAQGAGYQVYVTRGVNIKIKSQP